jgi:hypothetical protein
MVWDRGLGRDFYFGAGRFVSMRWKADRLAGGKLKDCKERGEWAELYFLMIAAGLGMKVLRPFGQTGVYDVGVERLGRLQRVQVKSTIYKRRSEEYSLNVMGPGRRMYAPGTVDYFAVLLIPIDTWYIIPYEVLGESSCTLHLRPKGGKQLYREYREAWGLLRGPRVGARMVRGERPHPSRTERG